RVRRARSFGPWWPLRRGTRRAENRTHGLSHGDMVDGLTEQLSFRLGEPQPNILAGLTPEQRRAVDHGEGPLLVVAGAGTGKTHVLTARIVHLISSGVAKPHQILAVTFTERAASQMQERVDINTPIGWDDADSRTSHRFAHEGFREFALELGRADQLRVLSPAEQVILVREHLYG